MENSLRPKHAAKSLKNLPSGIVLLPITTGLLLLTAGCISTSLSPSMCDRIHLHGRPLSLIG